MSTIENYTFPQNSAFRRTAILDSLKSLERESDFVLSACVMWNTSDVWLIKSTEMTEYQLEMWDPFWNEVIQIPNRFIGNRLKTINRFKPSPFLYSFEDNHNFMWEPIVSHDGTQLAALLIVSKNEFSEDQLEEVASASRQIGRNLELELIQLRISKMSKLLNESTKWKAQAELGAVIVHEINNPLTVIRARLKMSMDALNLAEVPTEKIKTYLQKSFDLTERVGKIIDGVRALSEGPLLIEKHHQALNGLVEDIRLICAPRLAESGAELFFHFADDLSVDCDPIQISQILVNLICNASDALRQFDGEKRIQIQGYEKDNSVFIDVIDSGPGVPEDLAEKIFNPFFTTKKSSGGTGIGLSLSRKIVENHGGEFNLEKRQAPTTFRIRLPQKTLSATE